MIRGCDHTRQLPTSIYQSPIASLKDHLIEDLLNVLTSPDLAEIVALTLRVTGIALIISTIIGAPLGAIIGLSKFPGKNVVRALLYTGMG